LKEEIKNLVTDKMGKPLCQRLFISLPAFGNREYEDHEEGDKKRHHHTDNQNVID